MEMSTLFAHNPSPFGVATAFTKLETRMTLEFAEWSKKVGELIESLPRHPHGLHQQHHTGDRLLLSDIVSSLSTVSITDVKDNHAYSTRIEIRASVFRYVAFLQLSWLMSKELTAEISSPSTHVQVHLALDAAKRLAAECDRHQTTNLGLPSRSRDSSSSGSKRR